MSLDCPYQEFKALPAMLVSYETLESITRSFDIFGSFEYVSGILAKSFRVSFGVASVVSHEIARPSAIHLHVSVSWLVGRRPENARRASNL